MQFGAFSFNLVEMTKEVKFGFLFYLEGEKMSIKVVYNKFSDVCKHYAFGKKTS